MKTTVLELAGAVVALLCLVPCVLRSSKRTTIAVFAGLVLAWVCKALFDWEVFGCSTLASIAFDLTLGIATPAIVGAIAFALTVRSSGSTALALLALFLVAVPTLLLGPAAQDLCQQTAARFRLWRYEADYLTCVERLEKGKPCASTRGCKRIALEPGPPLRVAFAWGGFLDNWIAVVYDPSRLVERVNCLIPDGDNWNDPHILPARRLFSGDMVRAIHLRGPWYLCGFT